MLDDDFSTGCEVNNKTQWIRLAQQDPVDVPQCHLVVIHRTNLVCMCGCVHVCVYLLIALVQVSQIKLCH